MPKAFVIIPIKLPLLYISDPIRIPNNKDEITSFVINANTIATIGGKMDNHAALKNSVNFPFHPF